jgi:hypothetical protein
MLIIHGGSEPMNRIYFAGPLFTSYERAFIDECAVKLRAEGFEVFIPHEGFMDRTAAEKEQFEQLDDRDKALTVFVNDYEALCWANVLIVMIDGPQIDDGSAVEIGIFCEQMLSGKDKKGIFGLSSDMRVGPHALPGEMKQLNFFAAGAIYRAGDIHSRIDEIIERLKGS